MFTVPLSWTYQYLDQAKYIITHGSTLGHEMLSRGRAVFFWSVQRCFGRDTVLGIASLVTPASFGPMRSIQFCSAHGYRALFPIPILIGPNFV